MENLVIKGVECRLNENGVVELSLEHVARGLGFTQRQHKGGKVYESIRWERLRAYLQEFGSVPICGDGFPPQVGENGLPEFIPENIFYKLCFKAENEVAKSFQDLVTDEILPTIRKHGGYAVKPLSTLDLLELTIKGMRENHQELQEIKKEVLELKAQTTTHLDYFTIAGYCTLHHIPVSLKKAAALGRMASGICKARGIDTDNIPDPRFGEVKMYPEDVLDEVFEQSLMVKGGKI
jgi:prophage antirepressor-like protein